MAEYIERTEELVLAVNAGARAIENTKRYHGASYCMGVFSDNHQEIPYLKAAEILRGVDEIPAADVAPVVRCKDCANCVAYRKRNGEVYFYKCEFHDIEVEPDDFCSYGERKDGEG
jgi:hypothetical protein